MPLKKSALLLIIMSVCSVSLLVFSSAIAPPATVVPIVPVKCSQVNCSIQTEEAKTFAPWEIISQIMLKSVA